jgi:flagellum-specific peptidoglycan hydrolase FlgJ
MNKIIKNAVIELNGLDDKQVVKVAGVLQRIQNWLKSLTDPAYRERVNQLKNDSAQISSYLKNLDKYLEQINLAIENGDVDKYNQALEEIKHNASFLSKELDKLSDEATDVSVPKPTNKEEVVQKEESTEGILKTNDILGIDNLVIGEGFKRNAHQRFVRFLSAGNDPYATSIEAEEAVQDPKFWNEFKEAVAAGKVIKSFVRETTDDKKNLAGDYIYYVQSVVFTIPKLPISLQVEVFIVDQKYNKTIPNDRRVFQRIGTITPVGEGPRAKARMKPEPKKATANIRKQSDKINLEDYLDRYLERNLFFRMSNSKENWVPNIQSEYNTPVGLYFYPLNIEYYKKLLNKNLPYASYYRYIWIYKLKPESNIIYVSKYLEQDFLNDFTKLSNMFPDLKDRSDEFMHRGRVSEGTNSTFVSDLLYVLYKQLKFNKYQVSKMLIDLGYGGIYDDIGSGTIHTNEPVQAVVFSTKFIEPIDVVNNYEKIASDIKFKPSVKQKQKSDYLYNYIFDKDPRIAANAIYNSWDLLSDNDLKKILIDNNPLIISVCLSKLSNELIKQYMKKHWNNLLIFHWKIIHERGLFLDVHSSYTFSKDISDNAFILNSIFISEKTKLEEVKRNGYVIKYINNPTEELQIEAIKQDGFFIKYMKNPSVKVRLEAVKQIGYAIKYLTNPSEEEKLAAVRQSGDAIKYMKDPSVKIQVEAVKQNVSSIVYIRYPSKEAIETFEQFKNKAAGNKETEDKFVKNSQQTPWYLSLKGIRERKAQYNQSNFVKAVKTNITKDEFVSSLKKAWPVVFPDIQISERGVNILWAHTAMETGNFQSMYNYNLGNIKATPKYSQNKKWTSFSGGEVIDGKTYKFTAAHPMYYSRSYDSLDEAMVDYLKILGGRFKSALMEAVNGNVENFSKQLKEQGYYTADEKKYTNAIKALLNEPNVPSQTLEPANDNDLAELEQALGIKLVANNLTEMVVNAISDKILPRNDIKIKIKADKFSSIIEYAYILSNAISRTIDADTDICVNGSDVEINCNTTGDIEYIKDAVQAIDNIVSKAFLNNYKSPVISIIKEGKSKYSIIKENKIERERRKFAMERI